MSAEQPPLPSSARVLLVEDNEIDRLMLSHALERVGIEVLAAGTADEAEAALRVEDVDLVILDFMLPHRSGLDLLATLRRRRTLADLPVIMVTSRADSADVVAALDLGANDYLVKPVDKGSLIARARTQLQLRRLSMARDEFLGMAGHDLKSCVAAMRRVAEAVLASAPPGTTIGPQHAALLENLISNASHTLHLIDDFVCMQAIEQGTIKLRRETVDVNKLARDLAATFHASAQRKQIDLVVELAPEIGAAVADLRRVRQVLQNLLDNAVKFASPGCRVSIRTRRQENVVHVEVTDDGPGLTAEDLRRIFQKHAQLSNKPTGGETSTGLGLAICKQLVELQGGTISVRNNPTRGATFWIELPAQQAAAEQVNR